jgi:hypothetical protein
MFECLKFFLISTVHLYRSWYLDFNHYFRDVLTYPFRKVLYFSYHLLTGLNLHNLVLIGYPVSLTEYKVLSSFKVKDWNHYLIYR